MAKKRKKINIRGFLVLILVLYLICMLAYYLINLPVKNIVINGTNNVSDSEIIEVANVKNYPSLFRLNTHKIKKKIKTLDLVSDVKIRRSITGKLTINITEAKLLFLNRNNNKIMLSNKSEIENDNKYFGIPVLINYVPSKILDEFINRFAKIDSNIISMISEIEYSEERLDDILLNDSRFLLRMNDTNTVYVDTINLDKLNNYPKYFATLSDNQRGIFHLDSNSSNISFNAYETLGSEIVE